MSLAKKPSDSTPVLSFLWLIGPTLFTLPWVTTIRNPDTAVLAGLGVAIASVGLFTAVRRGFRPMLAVSTAFLLCWLFIPATYQLASGQAAWSDWQVLRNTDWVNSALILSGLSYSAFLVGYVIASSRLALNRRPNPLSKVNSRPLLAPVGVFALACSIGILPIAARIKGGVDTFFAPRDLQAQFASSGPLAAGDGVLNAVAEILPHSLSVSGTLLLIVSWRTRPEVRHFWTASAIGAGFALTWVYANPIANTRFTTLVCFGAMLLAMFWPRSAPAGQLVTLGFVSVSMFIYPLVRLISVSEQTASRIRQFNDPWEAFASQDFDGFQQIINSFQFVHDYGHTLGRYFASAALVFVPRSIWPDKAVPASIDVATNRGYRFTNLSLPPSAEAYIDFGWIGVLVLSAAVGVAWSFLDNQWNSDAEMAGVVAFAAFAQVGLIRGPAGAQMPVIIFSATILLVALVISRRRPSLSSTSSKGFSRSTIHRTRGVEEPSSTGTGGHRKKQ